MALLDSEGFGLSTHFADYITYSAWRSLYQPNGTVVANGPQGDNYVVPSGIMGLRRLLPSTPSTLITGFRAAFASDNTGYVYFRDASANEQFHLEFSPTGQIRIVAGTTMLATSAAGTVPSTPTLGSGGLSWVFVEIMATISPTVGACTVRVSGVPVLSVTAANTQASGSAGAVSFIDWGSAYSPAYTMPLGLMHIYISDTTGAAPWNTFLGDVRVQTLYPTGNDSVQFTANGLASNWQNAALALPVPGTDYNASSTVGQQDTFAMAPISTTIGAVYGVNVKPLLFKSDAGARSGQTVLKSGATTALGTSTPLLATATQMHTMYQTDPNTSAQWALAAVNAAKPGYKISA